MSAPYNPWIGANTFYSGASQHPGNLVPLDRAPVGSHDVPYRGQSNFDQSSPLRQAHDVCFYGATPTSATAPVWPARALEVPPSDWTTADDDCQPEQPSATELYMDNVYITAPEAEFDIIQLEIVTVERTQWLVVPRRPMDDFKERLAAYLGFRFTLTAEFVDRSGRVTSKDVTTADDLFDAILE